MQDARTRSSRRSIDATDGKVVLAKVDVDANPALSQAFKVQSIPAVYAMHHGKVVDGFMGAYPESAVQEFVAKLLPTEEQNAVAELLAAGDEGSLRIALGMEPAQRRRDRRTRRTARGARVEATRRSSCSPRIPESDRTRKVAAAARVGDDPDDDHDATLTALLDKVKGDDDARQQFVDILELMGPDDPRTADYRRKLTQRLF